MIKNPTMRKLKNRGYTPVAYRMHDGVAYGAVIKRGRKWVTFWSPTTGRKRVPMQEERYMREL